MLSTRIDRHGEEVPVEAVSILPSSFDGNPQVLYAVVFAVIGFALILLLERAAVKKNVYAD